MRQRHQPRRRPAAGRNARSSSPTWTTTAAGKTLFDPASLLAMLKLLGVFDVGRDADGSPLDEPPGWLDRTAASLS